MHDHPTDVERLARLRIEERTTAARRPGAPSALRLRRTRAPRRRGDGPLPGT